MAVTRALPVAFSCRTLHVSLSLAWLSGLLTLAFVRQERRGPQRQALAGFSRWVLILLPLALLMGSWRLGILPLEDMLGSRYGLVLGLKLTGISVLLRSASVLRQLVRKGESGEQPAMTIDRHLGRELFLAGIVVLLSALLSQLAVSG